MLWLWLLVQIYSNFVSFDNNTFEIELQDIIFFICPADFYGWCLYLISFSLNSHFSATNVVKLLLNRRKCPGHRPFPSKKMIKSESYKLPTKDFSASLVNNQR